MLQKPPGVMTDVDKVMTYQDESAAAECAVSQIMRPVICQKIFGGT